MREKGVSVEEFENVKTLVCKDKGKGGFSVKEYKQILGVLELKACS